MLCQVHITSMLHTVGMTPQEKVPKNPLGPTGETVRANVKRLREGQNMAYAELSRNLAGIGRPIPVLGLRRIEAGERRVDADDLLALAIVLGVHPNALLLPPVSGHDLLATATGTKYMPSETLWDWASGEQPLGFWDPMWKVEGQQPPEGESRIDHARRVFQLRALPKAFLEDGTPNAGKLVVPADGDVDGNN